MKIVAAIDSFKGSISSLEAGYAVSSGFRSVNNNAEVVVCPLADGGEGTVEALAEGMNGRLYTITVTGPLGTPVSCTYAVIEETMTAVLEMSGAAGITLIPKDDLDPLHATTYGVGEVIIDAIDKGCRRFIIGIGGSATNDGGAGMLQALGYGLLDEKGDQIPRGAIGLKDLKTIDEDGVIPELKECQFMIACDVTNPLCGPNGCSVIYGPQKGATPSMIEDMDRWLSRYASICHDIKEDADMQYPGTGAAGGMGYAFKTFTNATLKPGIDIVIEETRLEDYIQDADLVVTGEGMLDHQTAMGKAPIGVARLAKKYNKKVIAFAGAVKMDAEECNKNGIDAFFPIVRGITTVEEAMNPQNAKDNLTATAKQVMRLIMAYYC
ncbi:glycerate kinase [Butyrivibrio fibrisolvens]|uniref:glycerate kinase family protein n=1 Tax=Butyrivibrio fibrisolvens TaxID=831 RepID=UPI0003B6E7F1|nr:glycerate kinase [Butyrivibrio fibrisolvens]